MVVFTCQHCGDSLKKPSVEKHYRQTKCRLSSPSLTCVDCLKDFFNEEYNTHTSCVTEAQRYSAKGTVIKEATGKRKQQLYVDMIQKLLNKSSLTLVQTKLLEICSGFDNVPKKEGKFLNFIGNVGRAVNYRDEDAKIVFKLFNDAWKNENKETNFSAATPSEVAMEESENVTLNGDNNVLGRPQKNEHKSKNNSCKIMQISETSTSNIDDNVESSKENVNVISKKDLKKQKKYEKYLKELEQTETECEKTTQVEKTSNHKDEIDEKSYKKSKVSKTKEVKHNIEKNEEEFTNVTKVSDKKKLKKRKLDGVACEEVIEKKKKPTLSEDLEEDESKTFNWSDTIKQVLQAQTDKELSLKRLGKKVIDEFQTVRSDDHRTYEELLAKFNRKVKKTKGVKVLKDRAKFIE